MTLSAAVAAGDEAAFAAAVSRHRAELHVHCYRMLGSLEDAEDAVQEAFLRAWRGRATYAGRASHRAWLYKIATNTCLDALARRPALRPGAEVLWLEPYPDELLDEVAGDDEGPEAVVVSRETIELAFIVAIQHLPPRQRAVLLIRDVLGWPARDTAELLDTSVAAVNSALQRAREVLRRELPERRADWTSGELTEAQRALVARYMEATDRNDLAAVAATLHEDVRFAMPPEPGVWLGRDTVVGAWATGGFGSTALGDLRCVLTAFNRQPAVANYVRRPGEDAFTFLAVDVLVVGDDGIRDVTAFGCGAMRERLGLPEEI